MKTNFAVAKEAVPEPRTQRMAAEAELAKLLKLTIAELELSMENGNESADALADSLTSVAYGLRMIDALVAQLPETADLEVRLTLEEQCQKALERIRSIVTAMQFYDRLTQRLTHISLNLKSMADLIGEPF